jgi:hypothetical protein
MEDPIESMKTYLLASELDDLRLEFQSLGKRLSWEDSIKYLESAIDSLYQKHWLKINHVLLSTFGHPELLGVDCDVFHILRSMERPSDFEQASECLFNSLIQVSEFQLANGGSTLFFNIERMLSTRTAIIISELVKARYRETILVLHEVDEQIRASTKDWVDVSRLWRTGNGYRFLKARNIGTHIHVNEYREMRNHLARGIGCHSSEIAEECKRIITDGNSSYLHLSKTLDEFMDGLIASLGIRGKFDQYYKTWIDHEGLDEF